MNVKLFRTGLIAFVLASTSISAEISIPNLMSAVQSVPEKELYDADYQFVKSNYESANSPQLFYAATVESHLGNKLESVKYLIAGQIRAHADMSLYEATSHSDIKLMAKLYGMIFSPFGGAGGNEIYQDKKLYSEVLENIRTYKPIISKSYNPGWNFKKIPNNSSYQESILKVKNHRLKQLTNLVSLLKNEEYLGLKKELEVK